MKGLVVRGTVCLALVLLGSLGLAAQEPCVITVRPGESIQAAIDAAPEGAVICLEEGEWLGSVRIEKSLTLRGQGPDKTFLRQGDSRYPTVIIGRDGVSRMRSDLVATEAPMNVTLSGVATSTDGGAHAILIKGNTDCLVSDCVVDEARGIYGISIWELARVTILNCAVSGSSVGIDIIDDTQVTITGSTIKTNSQGIHIGGSAQAVIDSCTIGKNRTGINVGDSAQAVIDSSTISENVSGITIEGLAQAKICDSSVEWSTSLGIRVTGSGQATIQGVTVARSALFGILVTQHAHAAITGSTFLENGIGVFIGGSAQAMIDSTNVSGNSAGIAIEDLAQATITGSAVTENRVLWGIAVGGSAQIRIERNLIRGNGVLDVVLHEPTCLDTDGAFTGFVSGKGNTGGEDPQGSYCPEDLGFLFTEEGGELDRRE